MAAAGVPPHLAIDYTYRMCHQVLQGQQLKNLRDLQVALFGAWHAEYYARTKRLPRLKAELRKLEPPKVMSPKAIRAAVMGMASAMGAAVITVKRSEL